MNAIPFGPARMAGQDHGPHTLGHALIEEHEETADHWAIAYADDCRRQLHRQNTQLYDHSRPVDEYISVNGAPAGLSLEALPTYDRVLERIETIVVATQENAQGLFIQLGSERFIPIPSGLVVLTQVGIVLSDNDRRILTATSWGTAGPIYFGLSGFASADWNAA